MIHIGYFLLLVIMSVQLIMAIHAARQDKLSEWGWFLLIPAAGMIAYGLALLSARSGKSDARQGLDHLSRQPGCCPKAAATGRAPLRTMNAMNARKNLATAASHSATGLQDMAEKLIQRGEPARAAMVYRQAMQGVHAEDISLGLGLAAAAFLSNQPQETVAVIDMLRTAHDDFRSPDGHLLYARALAQLGQVKQVASEFDRLITYYPGAEARLRYAEFLLDQDQEEAACFQLQALLETAKTVPVIERQNQGHWLKQARKMLRSL